MATKVNLPVDQKNPEIDIECICDQILRVFPNLEAIYLFGSFAHGDNSLESDIDIGIYLDHQTAQTKKPGQLLDLTFTLENIFNRDIDLVLINEVSTVLQKEIMFHGQRIYEKNPDHMDYMESLTLAFYQKLNEERADILKSIHKTGMGYNL